MMLPDLDTIAETFALIDDWEERYAYIIELGQKLPTLALDEKTPAHLVSGCASQVWIVTSLNMSKTPPVLDIRGESDAHIVKGLVALVLAIYSGKTPHDILTLDALAIFKELGLSEHLSTQRANGVRAVMARIRDVAKQALST
jgi:cysteine desulfuration protein SufE